jgi:hypothetical protein
MIDLSIAIVSYNTKGLLRDCLQSVYDNTGPVDSEVFVVDNNSQDGSADMVAEEFPQAVLIRNLNNRGFAAANNQALNQAKGRYSMLLNSDTLVRPGAFEKLTAFMDKHEQAGYCGPKLLNGDSSLQPSARRFPTPWTGTFAMLGLDQRRPNSRHALNDPAHLDAHQPVQADWLSGACLVVRKEAMEQVGLMDESYFLYFEENDWCLRMYRKGWTGWYVPDAEVVHLGGQSVGEDKQNAPFSGDHPLYWVQSRRKYMHKHYGTFGVWITEGSEWLLHGLVWLKHFWRKTPQSRQKADRARKTMHYLYRNQR